ncbi:MAG: heavy-metal-associated domain-containing protein [Trueperella sp.]|nr:heavy-metal-associated domain-containing protein [Trueperella sp.]
MKKATIQLEDLACPSCATKIEAAVNNVIGVSGESVKVLFNASKVKLEFDDEKTNIEAVADAIQKLGYQVEKSTVR